jgi:hypothetical protein
MSMQTRDQTIRDKSTLNYSFGTTWQPEDGRQLEFVDRVNTGRMKEIVEQFGWPGYSLVGSEGATAAFLIAQHADRDFAFQEYCLELMRDAVAAGDASAQHLAFLTDRVRVNQNRPQLYGTQVGIVEGQCVLKEIEDAPGVNERRFAMGLPPIGPLS